MSLSSGTTRLLLVLVAIFAVLAIIAITLGLSNVAHAGSISVLPVTSQQTGISVCGHGTAQIKPNRAAISAGVNVSASSASAARDGAATAMTAVINAIKHNGVADADIQTGYVSIAPQYNYNNGGIPTTVGYTASNSVNVTVRDVSAVSKLLDAITAAGGNHISVNGVSFSSSDPSAAATQAQQQALTDAKNQATHIAKSAGVTLGTPVSITVGGCGNSSSPVQYAAASGASLDQSKASTPIQPGQEDVSVDVAVVYAIG